MRTDTILDLETERDRLQADIARRRAWLDNNLTASDFFDKASAANDVELRLARIEAVIRDWKPKGKD